MPQLFRSHIIVLLLVVVGINGFSQEENYRSGELIIMLKSQVEAASWAEKWQQFQGKNTQLRPVRCLSERMNIYRFDFNPSSVSEKGYLKYLRQAPEVTLAQFNHRMELRGRNSGSRSSLKFPNDPGFSKKWGLHNTGQTGGIADADIDAPEAWSCTTRGQTVNGDSIVIAVIDGGFFLNHPDINYWKNTGEIPHNGIDDDNNGYIDDYHGWDAYNGDSSLPVDHHGTHVAGIAAATGDNDTGVTGVSWNARILPVAGSSTNEATVVAAYSYVLAMRVRYNKTEGDSGAFVVATNSSFGVNYGNPDNFPIWCALYDSMGKVGILSAAATMNRNENVDQVGDVPTACPSDYMIAVTNTTDKDNKNTNAAYGDSTIDLGAPGTDIYSTKGEDNYDYFTGTSMATPQLAGAIALIYGAMDSILLQKYKRFPDSMGLVLREKILRNVDTLPDLIDSTTSEGRLNVVKSLPLNPYMEAKFTKTSWGLTYQFEDVTSDGRISFWKFGDGDTSWQSRPRHTFPDTGKYYVQLVAFNKCIRDTVTDTVHVNCGAVKAQFEAVEDTTSYKVRFQNNSINGTSFLWKFGDGATDTTVAPSHTYADTGNYEVQLIAQSICGKDTLTKNIAVRCVSPTSDFVRTPTNRTVEFNVSHEVQGKYLWQFGDGDTSHAVNPTHQFDESGMYEVCLQVTNACGRDTTCKAIVIDAINDLKGDSSLIIYPNPNQGTFIIQSSRSSLQPEPLKIYNIRGQLVYQAKVQLTNGKATIHLPPTVSDNLYFLQWHNSKRVVTRKLYIH